MKMEIFLMVFRVREIIRNCVEDKLEVSELNGNLPGLLI